MVVGDQANFVQPVVNGRGAHAIGTLPNIIAFRRNQGDSPKAPFQAQRTPLDHRALAIGAALMTQVSVNLPFPPLCGGFLKIAFVDKWEKVSQS